MKQIIPDLKKHLDTTVSQLKEELKTIRTNHASPALLENLEVQAYGATMRLMELATITTDGPTVLLVMPFDQGTIPDIERAISASPLGISAANSNGRLVIRMPALSAEQRTKYVKLANEIVENFKHTVRGYRDDSRRKVKHSFEAKEMSEDDKFRLEKQIDEETSKTNETLQTLKSHKEAEITTV